MVATPMRCLMAKKVGETLIARVEDASDGHGAQFKIRLYDGVNRIPQVVLRAIASEALHGSALYVDGIQVEGDDVTISLCRGGLILALVDARWNPNRKDSKFKVILREDRDEDDKQTPATPLLPE
jgi:hypothetical protein